MSKLSFGEVLSRSFGIVFANLRTFFHLVTIPWIVSLVLRIGGAMLDEESLVVVLVEKAIDVVPTIMFMVAWMRFVLLGPARVGALPGTRWTARETAFLAYLAKIAGITFLLLAAFAITAGTIDPAMLGGEGGVDPELARREAMAAPFGTGFMVSALLALRVSFGLAATALDLPATPRQSWVASRGNAWKIIAILFVIFLTSAVATMVVALVLLNVARATGAGTGAAILVWTAAILVSYGGAAVAATAQALIFRALTGWRDGAPLQKIA